MNYTQNVQILLETVVRCGGNCSGCALSSFERMSGGSINWELFRKKALEINNYLKNRDPNIVEAVSLFLGQGDHFLLSKEEMEDFVEICALIVPDDLKHKTTTLITASAIGKEESIREKMDMYYDMFLNKNMPFFIQVVFDPKKMRVSDKFKNIYINNILYFKNKCGMTELTINVGDDLINEMTPNQFNDWVIEYGFKHVEMNWVLNNQTKNMWLSSYSKMFSWLKELLILNAKNHKYEINFVPFLARAIDFIEDKNLVDEDVVLRIKNGLLENVYLDNSGFPSFAQVGLISNLIPIKERLEEKDAISIINNEDLKIKADQYSKKIISHLLKRKSCFNCKFNVVCSQIGSYSWLINKKENSTECPWGIKDFLLFMEKYLIENKSLKETKFDKNPIQSTKLNINNNANYEYFDQKFK